MKPSKSFFIPLLILNLLFLSGCLATTINEFKDATGHPQYNQVLVYDKPYDYTFLRTLEALNTFSGWTLEETDKNKGLIILRNVEYGNLFDHDKWVVRFNVVSLARKKTSVALDPSSQGNAKGGDLLKRIDEVMRMASTLKGEDRAVALN